MQKQKKGKKKIDEVKPKLNIYRDNISQKSVNNFPTSTYKDKMERDAEGLDKTHSIPGLEYAERQKEGTGKKDKSKRGENFIFTSFFDNLLFE